MTQDERNEVGTTIAYTAQYYGKEYRREVIAMMVSDLEDLPALDVLTAFKTYRRDPKNRAFPLPAQIRDIVSPAKSNDAQAREILGLIKEAVREFGYMGEGVRDFVGPLGWAFIQESGGWYHLCAESDFINNPGLQAQARERLIDIVKHGPRQKVAEPRSQISHEQKIQVERQRQTQALEEWQIKDIRSREKPDPNADYATKSTEERARLILNFVEQLRKGDSNV